MLVTKIRPANPEYTRSTHGGAVSMRAHAKGTRKISPSKASQSILCIQLSHPFVMRPASRPRYHFNLKI